MCLGCLVTNPKSVCCTVALGILGGFVVVAKFKSIKETLEALQVTKSDNSNLSFAQIRELRNNYACSALGYLGLAASSCCSLALCNIAITDYLLYDIRYGNWDLRSCQNVYFIHRRYLIIALLNVGCGFFVVKLATNCFDAAKVSWRMRGCLITRQDELLDSLEKRRQ